MDTENDRRQTTDGRRSKSTKGEVEKNGGHGRRWLEEEANGRIAFKRWRTNRFKDFSCSTTVDAESTAVQSVLYLELARRRTDTSGGEARLSTKTPVDKSSKICRGPVQIFKEMAISFTK